MLLIMVKIRSGSVGTLWNITLVNHILDQYLKCMNRCYCYHILRHIAPNATDPCVSRLTITLTILNVVEIIGYFVECRTRIIQLYE
jgi:hypothetical protein